MEAIKHQVTINAPAIWRIEGEENIGNTLFFYFHDSHHEMKILKLDPNKEVIWECTVGHPEWLGTSVSFSIERKGDQGILQFAHSGWAAQTEFYKQCDRVWKGNVTDIKKLAEAEAFVRSLHHH